MTYMASCHMPIGQRVQTYSSALWSASWRLALRKSWTQGSEHPWAPFPPLNISHISCVLLSHCSAGHVWSFMALALATPKPDCGPHCLGSWGPKGVGSMPHTTYHICWFLKIWGVNTAITRLTSGVLSGGLLRQTSQHPGSWDLMRSWSGLGPLFLNWSRNRGWKERKLQVRYFLEPVGK